MEMDNDEVIATLNELIETCKDGEASYETCATDAAERHSKLQTMFADLQHGRAAAATALQDLVRSSGGQPRTDGSLSSAMHRGWVNLKTSIAGGNDEAVLVECERGEDATLRKYSAALGLKLPAEVRTIVERQYTGVQVNHVQIKTLRDQLKLAV
jgi:uncharacterized protein (TIGR02284 family)